MQQTACAALCMFCSGRIGFEQIDRTGIKFHASSHGQTVPKSNSPLLGVRSNRPQTRLGSSSARSNRQIVSFSSFAVTVEPSESWNFSFAMTVEPSEFSVCLFEVTVEPSEFPFACSR